MRNWIILINAVLLFSSCNRDESEPGSWKPVQLDDGWSVSSLLAQDMDSIVTYNTYVKAGNLDNLYSLLIVKNGYLVAEKYYNGITANNAVRTASVTKSFISALTGIAIHENLITGTDQKLKDFFPEIDWESADQRKSEITIGQILQMRSGYPWEEFDGYLETLFNSSNWIPFLKDFPLMHDPGTQFGYSNFTAHIMGIIVARSADQTLLSFANNYLFGDMSISISSWPKDGNGYYYGSGDISMTSRNLAKFGQLYLNHGLWNDNQLVPSEWISESLQIYSSTTYPRDIHSHIHNLGYGYLWWSGVSGNHHFNFAWGHGGQMIAIIPDLSMVVVATAAPQPGFDNAAWQKEKAVMELVGKLIEQL